MNHRIQKFTCDGAFITKWGKYGSGDGEFNEPWGVAVDAAGNVYVADGKWNDRVQKFAPDSTPPTTTIELTGNMGLAEWYMSDVTVTLSATDDASGVAKISLSLDGGATWLDMTYTRQFTIITEGVHTIYYYSVDNAGNQEAIRSETIKIDKTPPTTAISISGTKGSNDWWVGWSGVTVTLTATDDLSGVKNTYYQLEEDPIWVPYSSPFNLLADDVYTIRYWSNDNAGNKEAIKSETIKIDKYPPTTAISLWGPLPGNDGWWKSYVSVEFIATDKFIPTTTESGVANTYYSVDGGPWLTYSTYFYVGYITYETDGIHTIQYYSVDNAGNKEAIKSETIKIDRIPPITVISLSGTPGVGWWKSDVTVTLTPTDDISGVANTYYSLDGGATWSTYPFPFTITTEGTHTVQFYSVDKAGNQEYPRSEIIKIDKTPPTTAISLSGTMGANDWWTSDVTVTLTATDDISGVRNTLYSLDLGPFLTYTSPFTITTEGTHTVRYYSNDHGSLQEAIKSEIIKIDKTPPTTTISIDGNLGDNGWWRSDVTVTLTATDDISGVANTYYRLNWGTWLTYTGPFTITTEGQTNLRFYSVDKAGNGEADTVKFINIDKTASTTSLSRPFYSTFELIATDDMSGVANNYYSVDGGPWLTYSTYFYITTEGIHTIQYYSVDNAGNRETTKTETVIIDKTPPTTAISLSGTMGANDWWTSDVTVTLTATDDLSEVAYTKYYNSLDGTWLTYTGPFTITTEGVNTLHYYSVDASSRNNMEDMKTETIKIDKTAPDITIYEPKAIDYYNFETITLDFAVTDATSGIATQSAWLDEGKIGSAKEVFNGDQIDLSTLSLGPHTFSVSAKDYAGNSAKQKLTFNIIDITPPTTTISLSGTLGNNDWYITDVTVTLTATDDASGVANTRYSLDWYTWLPYTGPFTITTEGTNTLRYLSVDNAGNVETLKSTTIKIDKTSPSISVNEPLTGDYYNFETITLDFAVTDAPSGVAATTATLDSTAVTNGQKIDLYTLSLGPHTLTVTATDNAGNLATQQVTFNIIQITTSIDVTKQLNRDTRNNVGNGRLVSKTTIVNTGAPVIKIEDIEQFPDSFTLQNLIVKIFDLSNPAYKYEIPSTAYTIQYITGGVMVTVNFPVTVTLTYQNPDGTWTTQQVTLNNLPTNWGIQFQTIQAPPSTLIPGTYTTTATVTAWTTPTNYTVEIATATLTIEEKKNP